MLDPILQIAGRAHPMLLHLPIGTLASLALVEILSLLRLIELPARVRAALAWLAFLSAAASVASGLLLAREAAYSGGGETLNLHKWLGIGFASCVLLVCLSLTSAKTRKAYPALLLIAVAGMFPTGHLGATMTHGEGFLTEPLFPRQTDPVRGSGSGGPTPVAARGIYPEQVAPIFERYCISCHGESKQQGKLALHIPAAILAGGATGTALEPGDPANSELVIRLRLPMTDRAHMPPKVRPQPDTAAIHLIEQWIAAGAPFEGGDLLPLAPALGANEQSSSTSTRPDAAGGGIPSQIGGDRPGVPAHAVDALRARHVHAEVIEPAADGLWVTFDAATGMSDAEAAELLSPVAPFVTDLSLAGTRPGTSTITAVATMPGLRRLNLARTSCSESDLRALAPLAVLEELNLSGTSIGEPLIAALAEGFPRLKRVFLWRSGISTTGIDSLRARRPGLQLMLDADADAPIESEPPLTFSSDAPPPTSTPPPATAK